MAHTKSHYRYVNGKAVHVAEHDDSRPVGRPAELHERTVIGKHKSGTTYLRATDSEDGGHIKAAAEKLGIPVTKKRAGANHLGRVGAYDHFHFNDPAHAVAVHEELKKQAGQGAPQMHEPGPDTTSPAVTPASYDDKAKAASDDAYHATEYAGKTNRAEHHEEAGAAHMKAQDLHSDAETRNYHSKMADQHFADAKKLKEDAATNIGKGMAEHFDQTKANEAKHPKGSKVRDVYDKEHEVIGHNGNMVHTTGGDFHHTKVFQHQETTAEPTHESLKQHPQYTPQDHAYFKEKGWSPEEIKKKWDAEHKDGVAPTHVNKYERSEEPEDKRRAVVANRKAEHPVVKADAATQKANLASASGDHAKAHEAHAAAKDAHFNAAAAYQKTGDATREQKHLNAGVEHGNKAAYHFNKGKERAAPAGSTPADEGMSAAAKDDAAAHEAEKKPDIAKPLPSDHNAVLAHRSAQQAPKVHAMTMIGGKKVPSNTHKASAEAKSLSQIAEHTGDPEHHKLAAAAHWKAAQVHEIASNGKGKFYYSNHSNAQSYHTEAAKHHGQKAQEAKEKKG